MSLKLYFHPLASFCHKALIALYENGIPFEPIIVDLRDEVSSAAFRAISPMAKMPVLRDEARSRTVAESTIIIEFVDAHYTGYRPDAIRAHGCGSCLADADVGPLLRPLRSGTDAEDRD